MTDQAFHHQHSDSPHDGDPARPGRYCGPHCDLYEPADPDEARELAEYRRNRDIEDARAYRAEGKSLFEIASRLGRSKEWLREYAGLR
jgi:hypothetical protein